MTVRRVVLYPISVEPVVVEAVFDPADGFPWPQTNQPRSDAWPRYTWVLSAVSSPLERPSVASWVQPTAEPVRTTPRNHAALLPASVFVGDPADTFFGQFPWPGIVQPVQQVPRNDAALLPAAVFVGEPSDVAFKPEDGFPWRDIAQPHGSAWPVAIPVYQASLRVIDRPSVASWYVQPQEPVRQTPFSLAAILADGAYVGEPIAEAPFDPADFPFLYPENPIVAPHNLAARLPATVAPVLVSLLVLDVDWDDDGIPTDDTGRHSPTVQGNVVGQTAVRCSGNSAGQFFQEAGVEFDGVTYGLSSDWEFEDRPFFIRTRVAWQAAAGLGTVIVSNFQLDAFTNQSWMLLWAGPDSGGPLLQFVASKTGKTSPAGDIVNLTSSFTPTLNQWYEVAVGRDNADTWRLYLDGAVVASVVKGSFSIFPPAFIPLMVGRRLAAIGSRRVMTGWIDDVEISVGEDPFAGAYTAAACESGNIWQTPEQNQPMRVVDDRDYLFDSLFAPVTTQVTRPPRHEGLTRNVGRFLK